MHKNVLLVVTVCEYTHANELNINFMRLTYLWIHELYSPCRPLLFACELCSLRRSLPLCTEIYFYSQDVIKIRVLPDSVHVRTSCPVKEDSYTLFFIMSEWFMMMRHRSRSLRQLCKLVSIVMR